MQALDGWMNNAKAGGVPAVKRQLEVMLGLLLDHSQVRNLLSEALRKCLATRLLRILDSESASIDVRKNSVAIACLLYQPVTQEMLDVFGKGCSVFAVINLVFANYTQSDDPSAEVIICQHCAGVTKADRLVKCP
jgi:hypothetical protein